MSYMRYLMSSSTMTMGTNSNGPYCTWATIQLASRYIRKESKLQYLVSSSTMTMGSSKWPGARKLYCRSLCFVKPVVNTWDYHFEYMEPSRRQVDDIVLKRNYQSILEIDGPRPLAPLVS